MMVVGRAAKGREAQEDGFKLITGLRGRREDRSFDGEFRLSTRRVGKKWVEWDEI